MGYLIREQSHDSGGKFGGNVYVLQDEAPPLPGNPSNGEAEKTPLPENTVNGENRQRETPSAGFPPQQNKDLTEEETKKPPKAPQGGKRPSKYDLAEDAKPLLLAYVGEDRELHQALGAFIELRTQLRAINSARAVKMLLGELDRLSEGRREDKLLLIRQSVANSWKSVFPLRRGGSRRSSPCRPRDGGGTDGGLSAGPVQRAGVHADLPADRGRRDDQPPAGGLHRAHGAGGVPGHPGPAPGGGEDRPGVCAQPDGRAGPGPPGSTCWP